MLFFFLETKFLSKNCKHHLNMKSIHVEQRITIPEGTPNSSLKLR